MPRRHTPKHEPLPRLWLMTDERMGEALLDTLRRLPRGSGVVFRHYSLGRAERQDLFDKVERIARARRLMLLIGGQDHGRKRGAITAPVHSIPERITAERNGARLIFVSPVFATASHPNAKPLGRLGLGRIMRGSQVPVIALGGMDAKRARSLAIMGIHGWAGIDAFSKSGVRT